MSENETWPDGLAGGGQENLSVHWQKTSGSSNSSIFARLPVLSVEIVSNYRKNAII